MAERKLEDAISQAAEIASKAPKNLQEAAFNRALELLRQNGREETRHGERVARVAEILAG